ncbi:TonB-dependent receptor [Sphingosinicella microcystinivorans]|uniref:TonB-dependent receptor n=1 Tax=Sphingosinicella microcystinivorans TaxID=335406 RepID=UPI0022F3A37B|nr:TonB-dependent receptor [Sphingosinicella microcystinivorans]WBX85429.1 TonB-dependent receptor [Sphingosinicella microcystinivorans]
MKRSSQFFLTGVAALALTGTARAQEQEPLDDSGAIIVTARKMSERLQDVPATVTALTQDMLETAGVVRAEDFIRLTPGVSLVQTAEVGDTQVSIRGINGAKDTENSYALIVDGIVMTNPAALNREYANLRQIEVLKGPQSALYGRNASAGAFIITTNKPGDELGFEAKASGGEHNSYFASATLNLPIVPGSLAASLHADYRTTDGFFRNRYLNARVVDDYEGYNFDGRLVWTGGGTEIDAKIHVGHVSAGPASFNAAFALPAFADFLDNPLFFEDVNDHKKYEFVANVDPSNIQDSFDASIKLTHEFDTVLLNAWVLYSNIRNEWLADGTSGGFGFFFQEPSCRASTAALYDAGFVLPGPQALGPTPETSIFGPTTPTTCDGYQYQVRNQKDLSFEIRLGSSGNNAFDWVAGLYFLDINREVGVAQGIDTGGPIIRSLYNAPSSSSPTEALSWDKYDSKVYAVFGQASYDLTPELEFSAALRYDREKRKVHNLVPTDARTRYIVFDGGPFIGGAPLNPGLNPAINPAGVLPDQKRTFEQLQPKISVTWDASRELTLFGSWGVGFRSGGFNSQGSKATIDLFLNEPLGATINVQDSFKKETSSAFEAGFKANTLGGRLTADGSVYWTEIKNMQFFEFFVGAFGLLRQVTNIDKARAAGVELNANYKVSQAFSLYAGANLMDTKVVKNTTRVGTEGVPIPYAPKYTLNAGGDLVLPVTSDIDFRARLDWQMTGPTWFHVVHGLSPTLNGVPSDMGKTRRDAYHTTNLRAGFEMENWGITLFAQNLFNKKYLREVIPAPEFGGAFIFQGAHRLVGVEGKVRF